MKWLKLLAPLLLAGFPAAAFAQDDTAAPEIAAPEDDGVLEGTVTGEGGWQDLGIAIPAFATNANVSTAANTDGTGALGRELARVITADLKNNGLFKPTGPDSLPRPTFTEITAPGLGLAGIRAAPRCWCRAMSARRDDGRLTVGCYLYDVAAAERTGPRGLGRPARRLAPRRA